VASPTLSDRSVTVWFPRPTSKTAVLHRAAAVGVPRGSGAVEADGERARWACEAAFASQEDMLIRATIAAR